MARVVEIFVSLATIAEMQRLHERVGCFFHHTRLILDTIHGLHRTFFRLHFPFAEVLNALLCPDGESLNS